ncbi:MAG: DUF4093 domain-containing protein [Clostridia bacterium]|nr:DUF4093 domain-containing protein [Clostridia bacterium]
MLSVNAVLVVEGKYDRIRLASVTDAPIFTTDGFRIFKDKEQLTLLRRLAKDREVVILTDSDGAGLQIRNYLIGALPDATVRQAYIPPIAGKEKRKSAPSKEGLLGVEGMDTATLEEALRRAGVVTDTPRGTPWCTPQRLYRDGLCGRPDSAAKRKELLQLLQLPTNLSQSRLRDVLNTAVSEQEYLTYLEKISLC